MLFTGRCLQYPCIEMLFFVGFKFWACLDSFHVARGPITKGENRCSTLCLIQISHQKLSKDNTVCLQHMQKKKYIINVFLFVPLVINCLLMSHHHHLYYNIIQKLHHFNTCEKMTSIISFNQPLYRTPGHQP